MVKLGPISTSLVAYYQKIHIQKPNEVDKGYLNLNSFSIDEIAKIVNPLTMDEHIENLVRMRKYLKSKGKYKSGYFLLMFKSWLCEELDAYVSTDKYYSGYEGSLNYLEALIHGVGDIYYQILERSMDVDAATTAAGNNAATTNDDWIKSDKQNSAIFTNPNVGAYESEENEFMLYEKLADLDQFIREAIEFSFDENTIDTAIAEVRKFRDLSSDKFPGFTLLICMNHRYITFDSKSFLNFFHELITNYQTMSDADYEQVIYLSNSLCPDLKPMLNCITMLRSNPNDLDKFSKSNKPLMKFSRKKLLSFQPYDLKHKINPNTRQKNRPALFNHIKILSNCNILQELTRR